MAAEVRQLESMLKKIRAGPLGAREARRLAAACRDYLRRHREDGLASRVRLATAALLVLGEVPDRPAASLKDYDHHRFGPFLGISDEGGAAQNIVRAAWNSPKARAVRGATPLEIGVALDAERLGAIGELVVGPDEYAGIWRRCAGKVLLTTNVGTKVNLRFYKSNPLIAVAGGDADAALSTAKEAVAEAFRRFLHPPDGRPRPLTVFIEFEPGSRRGDGEKRRLLRALRNHVASGRIADPKVHRLGYSVRIGWNVRGRDLALRAIDLARGAGLAEVALDGVKTKEADTAGAMPGLLNYLKPGYAAQVLRHGAQAGVRVRPRNAVDPDTVARGIWSSLNSARGMGLHLGKYGLFPLTLDECESVAAQVQRWFQSWSVAPVCFVDQPTLDAAKVYAGHDAARGLEVWLRRMAKHGVRVVLIDTVDKSKGWRILRSHGDPNGLLGPKQVARIDRLAAKLGIKALWAGGITPAQALEFGKLGVFGIYVTTAAAREVPVRGRYRRDPLLATAKQPTYDGVLQTKVLLEAGFLSTRPELAGEPAARLDSLSAALLEDIERELPRTRALSALSAALAKDWCRFLRKRA